MSAITGTIIKPQQLDTSKLSFGSVKVLDNGGKIAYVNYNKESLLIQTPEMVIPRGIERWPGNAPDAPEKFNINLNFTDLESRESVRSFYDALKRLDGRMCEAGIENGPAWLKKRLTADTVGNDYTPNIKVHKDDLGEPTGKYPDSFKINIPTRDGKFACDVFDDNRQPLDLAECDDLRGARVAVIMKLSIVWMAGGKFGCKWNAVQMRVIPKVSIKGYAFQDDDDRVQPESDIEERDEETAPKKKQAAKEVDLQPESEDAAEQEAPPPPDPKKPTSVEDEDDLDAEIKPPAKTSSRAAKK